MLFYSLLAAISLVGFSSAETLFASHYSGQIYTLDLAKSGSAYSLSVASKITGCGALPAWLTYDAAGSMLYCSDETFSGGASISSFKADSKGVLSNAIKASTPQTSKVTTFKLPLTASSKPQQEFTFTMSGPGPNAGRQDAPHPHEVVLGPNGDFLFAPDLGADLIRVWQVTNSTGNLTACPAIKVPAGNGPRHAAFKKMSNGRMVVYVANELANNIAVFRVTYPNGGCPAFQLLEDITPFANNATAPYGTKVAEVHVLGDYLYSTVRNDKFFSGNDTVAAFSIDGVTGEVDFVEAQSSWGTYPRTFAINAAGTLLAVGDQTTANVAILSIGSDGALSEEPVANIRLGSAGHAESEDGLSSVVWAE
ncbi:hypothetical protein LTR56_016601 [Elasticomyces elasticus]|nr:hypothetical protein LTR56_016601 [Elasticomyces elasticus]KAK3650632.1 hypothetical protein LTR22_012490 [Elasticomyces elasticus]KAK4913965.1 hypothetical protein LTR49_017783 [Elasticomyces elasticus]KAK5753129.1 hypothetical protein LTS12_016808 [Elasticomyces elasticus]